MKSLFDNISKKNGSNKIKVGIITQDDRKRFLLIKEKNDTVNQYFYNIPIIDVNSLDEINITNEASKKYGIKINNVVKYVNEFNVLDEECNNVLQVNMYFDLDEKSLDSMKNYSWKVINELDGMVNTKVKESLEIYNYNNLYK